MIVVEKGWFNKTRSLNSGTGEERKCICELDLMKKKSSIRVIMVLLQVLSKQ